MSPSSWFASCASDDGAGEAGDVVLVSAPEAGRAAGPEWSPGEGATRMVAGGTSASSMIRSEVSSQEGVN